MRISDWSSDVCSSDLKLLSSVAAQQPQAEPVLRIVPPLRNAQPRFGRQRNDTGVGVLVAVLDLHRIACIEAEAPPFDCHVPLSAPDKAYVDAAGLAPEFGRAAWREIGSPSVQTSVVDVSIKKKNQHYTFI